MGEKFSDKFRLELDFHVILEIFYMPQICDMGQTALLPLRRKEGVLRIFFALKNPTASAGFEPANLGTKGQHATSRPPKPLIYIYDISNLRVNGCDKFKCKIACIHDTMIVAFAGCNVLKKYVIVETSYVITFNLLKSCNF